MRQQLYALLAMCAFITVTAPVRAEDKPAPEVKPLEILFITGGGYHDYAKQPPFLKEKLSELANVDIEIVNGGKDSHAVPALFSDPKFGEAYDGIIYDLCYATDSKPIDPKTYEKVFDVTKAGKPAVLIDCAMHCFRPPEDWK